MTILKITTYPDPILKKISKPVDKVDDNLRKFMNDMLDTMYDDRGVGLAAVQVSVLKRILVMDVEYKIGETENGNIFISNKAPIFLVNPEITYESKQQANYKEGCLSFPGIRADVKRPKEVTVKYLDYDGNEQIIEADGLLATCVQHEIDHLNGITFIDHLSKLKKEMAIRKYKKITNPS